MNSLTVLNNSRRILEIQDMHSKHLKTSFWHIHTKFCYSKAYSHKSNKNTNIYLTPRVSCVSFYSCITYSTKRRYHESTRPVRAVVLPTIKIYVGTKKDYAHSQGTPKVTSGLHKVPSWVKSIKIITMFSSLARIVAREVSQRWGGLKVEI